MIFCGSDHINYAPCHPFSFIITQAGLGFRYALCARHLLPFAKSQGKKLKKCLWSTLRLMRKYTKYSVLHTVDLNAVFNHLAVPLTQHGSLHVFPTLRPRPGYHKFLIQKS